MAQIDLNDFNREIECIYDEEKYSVRDNGAVLRHPREGKRTRIRPTDNQWTLGKLNQKTGYLEIASVRVHRVVATAFHGTPASKKHIVDHIDTNRQNNRPDNLRWLTRLENALNNPITRKRIEFVCGSIEAFLDNPALLRQSSVDSNFKWMRAVTPQEAQACKENLHLWAESDKKPSGGSLGEWVFQPKSNSPQKKKTVPIFQPKSNSPQEKKTVPIFYSHNHNVVMAKTPGAVQINWRIPAEFPCCPSTPGENPIKVYADQLNVGSIFAQNHITKSKVLKTAISQDSKTLWVMCEMPIDSIKPWSLAEITYEDSLYIHKSLGQFFTEEGVEKQFCLAQGLQWTGGDTFDDYC